jgi:hypothetical protein
MTSLERSMRRLHYAIAILAGCVFLYTALVVTKIVMDITYLPYHEKQMRITACYLRQAETGVRFGDCEKQ